MPGGNRAVFLDRDGTIVEDPGYLTRPEQLKLLPGAADAIARLREAGFLVILATNQSAVARGMMTEQDLAAIHERLGALLADANPDARIDAVYCCPFHPDATVPAYRQESYLRKPRPGMLFKAAREHQLDLGRCWMVGDSERDVQAGKTAGCRAIRIDHDPETETMADQVLASLADAAEAILGSPDRREARTPARPEETAAGLEEAQPEPATSAEPPLEPEAAAPPAEPSAVPQPAAPQPGQPVEPEAAAAETQDLFAVTGQPTPAAPSPASREQSMHPAQPDSRQRAHPPADRTALVPAGPVRPPDTGEMPQLLGEILQQLRQLNRGPANHEISATKIIGGLFQMVSLGLFALAMISFWEGGKSETRALVWGVAAVFTQVASLSFFLMHREG